MARLVSTMMLMVASIVVDTAGDTDKTSCDSMCMESLSQESCQEHNIHQEHQQIDEEFLLIGSIIDLERYPIHLNGAPYERLVEDCRKQLKAVGSVDLPGFIRKDVIEKMAMEVDNLPSFNRLNIVSPYRAFIDDKPDSTFGHQPHPSRRMFAQDTNAVAGDQIPVDSLIRKVYDSPLVMQFIARASGQKNMFHMEDEFQSINIMYMYDGGSRAWHYDGTDTVVTLLLQKAEEGGEYEFAPFIRGEEKGDERFADVAKLFEGSYEGNIVKNAAAGTLNLFNGIRSLHRVRAVYGPTKRIVAVLSYDSEPHKQGSIMKNVALYGERVEQIYKSRGLLPS